MFFLKLAQQNDLQQRLKKLWEYVIRGYSGSLESKPVLLWAGAKDREI
jgi:hypothetical protein